MIERRFNWPLWSGLLLTLAAFVSYPYFFARFPITRDVPWVTYILFAIAVALLVAGWRRATRKVAASIAIGFSAMIIAFSFFMVFIYSRQLPTASGAPAVGQPAPDFALADQNGKTVALSQLLTAPGSRGVMLVFYRGYW